MVRTDGGAAATEPRNDLRTDPAVDPLGLNVLAVEALGNDPKAVRRFLLAITPAIRRTCCGVLGRRHEDLEDTIQDALGDTMRALPRYRFEGSVIHYVTKIAMRLAIEARRRGTLRSGGLHAPRRQDAEVPRHGEGEGDRFEQAELVRQVLQDLSPVQADVLILHLVLGFTIDEIASITHARVNTIKKRLREGRGSLRRRLERMGHAPSRQKGSRR